MSSKMAPFDRPYSSLLYHFYVVDDLEIWVRGHSRSLKLVPFESLGVVSYSPSIVTIAIFLTAYEIFSMSVLHGLEN